MKKIILPLIFGAFAFSNYYMPSEEQEHQGTIMVIQAKEKIWGKRYKDVNKTLKKIAETIAKYEKVYAIIGEDSEIEFENENIIPIKAESNDLWARDTSSVFVRKDNKLYGINFNFNGWGEKQEYELDAELPEIINEYFNVETINSNLVLEGGSIEVDGMGTAIISESSVINDNRNPNKSKEEIEKELKELLGLKKIIWIPGIKDMDITDGHTDFYARFVKPGVVVASIENDKSQFDYDVTRENIEILKNSTDANGNKLEVHIIPAPSTIRARYANNDFAAGYINFYVINNAVLIPEFGDKKADTYAYETIKKLFPDRDVIQLNIDPIASGGGGIHCTTQQIPKK